MDKTAFVTHTGLYRYNRMPLGLKNAPAMFQRAMDIFLTPEKWQNALLYIGDIVIFSTSLEEHLYHLDSVLQLINKAERTLKEKK